MNKNYEVTLPEGYRAAMTVDAESKKFTILANLAAVAVMIVGIIGTLASLRGQLDFADFSLLLYIIFLVSIVAYIVLHELVHGAAYKLLTGQKLTFGFSKTVAFCGVPDIYVYRKASLISLTAPLLVFTLVFLGGALVSSSAWVKLLFMLLFWVHLGGCSGDIYDTFLYLFRFRNPSTLMRDTGPVQTIYVRERE